MVIFHKKVSVLLFILVITLSLTTCRVVEGRTVSNNLQVLVNSEGDILIDWFSVSYQVHPQVYSYYTIRLNSLYEKNLWIKVDIILDKVEDTPIFNQAELIIWASSFLMENDSYKEIIFSFPESYTEEFLPSITEYTSSQYSCTYFFNLTESIQKAKSFFATATGYNYEQSELRCIIGFNNTGLTQGISEGGAEKQLRYDFVCKTHRLEHFTFRFSIPDDYQFIDKQTLNDKDMYITPNELFLTDCNDYGYDTQGNPFWMCSAVINWKVPKALNFWETHPFDWILSALVGFLISQSIIISKNRLWKPKLSIEIVPQPWIHPRIGFAFYRLNVKNSGRTTAHDCKIDITFKDHNNRLFSLKGKWDSLPEPTGAIQATGLSSIFPAFIPLSEKLTIGTDDGDTFCILVKDNEDSFYAFNARSYLHNYKNPRWALPLGEYFVDVELKCEETIKHQKFHVRNTGNTIHDIEILKKE
jgi:hypothetical protein